MEVLRGTLREVVAVLPDDADIKAVVPVRYQSGQLEAIYDVIVALKEPLAEECEETPVSKPKTPRVKAQSTPARVPSTPQRTARSTKPRTA